LEGTLAGLLASVILSAVAYALKMTDQTGAIICVVAAQIANLCESFIGAALQGRKGYEWVPLLHLRLDSQTIVCCSFPM
jgi:uncharacterized membrane protein